MNKEILKINWNSKNRAQYINLLKEETFDLVIIGGGITGAGIAREATLRGIKTALIDKEDFAFGTSSRSSKLVHGGFRYLDQKEFSLVRESTTERNWLRNHFSHNVRPLKFNLCSYDDGKLSPAMVKIGIRLYDSISDTGSKYKQYGKHLFLNREEAIKDQPNIDHSKLKMIGQYYDNNLDDARLTIETIKESIVLGDLIAVNYVKAEDFVFDGDDKIISLNAKDMETGAKITLSGKNFVNATGIWTDELLEEGVPEIIRPTKGVHVVVPKERVGNNEALGVNSIDDGRFFFILERNGYTVIGTTDTDYPIKQSGKVNEDFDFPYCTKEDCDYLFRTVNNIFPKANLTYDDIISTYAGIRPLVMEEGKSESDISRKHKILDTKGGLTTICGGKLTTFRKMAEELIYHIIKDKNGFKEYKFKRKMLKKDYSKKEFLINLSKKKWNKFLKKNPSNLPDEIHNLLYQQYGKGAMDIIKMVEEDPEMGNTLLEGYPFIVAEIYYILKNEFVLHLFDVLRRRTELFMKIKHTKQKEIAHIVAEIMATEYNWNDQRKHEEITKYLDHIAKTIWF